MMYNTRRISANTIHINEIVMADATKFECLQSRGLVVLEKPDNSEAYFTFDLTASLNGSRMNSVDNLQRFLTSVDRFEQVKIAFSRFSAVALKHLKDNQATTPSTYVRFILKRSGDYVDFPVAIRLDTSSVYFQKRIMNDAYSADQSRGIELLTSC
jgi:hypothetical protein